MPIDKDTESIPLVDEPSTHTVVVNRSSEETIGCAIRGHRSSTRHDRRGFHVCFCPQDVGARIDRVECPVIDVSSTGMALVFDRELRPGQSARVLYRTISYQLVRILCKVRRCDPQADGTFHIGLQFGRTLRADEMRPLKHRPGRDLVPGVRPRKMHLQPQALVPAEPIPQG